MHPVKIVLISFYYVSILVAGNFKNSAQGQISLAKRLPTCATCEKIDQLFEQYETSTNIEAQLKNRKLIFKELSRLFVSPETDIERKVQYAVTAVYVTRDELVFPQSIPKALIEFHMNHGPEIKKYLSAPISKAQSLHGQDWRLKFDNYKKVIELGKSKTIP